VHRLRPFYIGRQDVLPRLHEYGGTASMPLVTTSPVASPLISTFPFLFIHSSKIRRTDTSLYHIWGLTFLEALDDAGGARIDGNRRAAL